MQKTSSGKDSDKGKDEECLSDLLKLGLALFGSPDPVKAAKRKKQFQMLNNLEYPGGKRVH